MVRFPRQILGDVEALVMYYINDLIPFERTIKQTTVTMPLASNNEENYKLTRAATLRQIFISQDKHHVLQCTPFCHFASGSHQGLISRLEILCTTHTCTEIL